MTSDNRSTDPRAPHGDAPLLEAVGLGLERGGRTLLHHVSLSVRRGQVVVVIGPKPAFSSRAA